MKKIILLITILIVSCNSPIDKNSLKYLNGYWQITKVKNADGNKKEYKINEVYDYFEVKDSTGFHKKVRWQVTGKFLINDLKNKVVIKNNDDIFTIEFKSKFGNHTHEIIEISETKLVLQSKEGVIYYYEKVALK